MPEGATPSPTIPEPAAAGPARAGSPLLELTKARLRELIREPEAVF